MISAPLLTEVAVSRQLRIPLSIRYRQEDVEAWLERELQIRCDYK
jgi:hypothetical protein